MFLTVEALALYGRVIHDAEQEARKLLRREAPFLRANDRDFIVGVKMGAVRVMVRNALLARALVGALQAFEPELDDESAKALTSKLCGDLENHEPGPVPTEEEVTRYHALITPYNLQDALTDLCFQAEERVLAEVSTP